MTPQRQNQELPAQNLHELAGTRIPDPRILVPARSHDEPSVGRKRHRAHVVEVADELGRRLTSTAETHHPFVDDCAAPGYRSHATRGIDRRRRCAPQARLTEAVPAEDSPVRARGQKYRAASFETELADGTPMTSKRAERTSRLSLPEPSGSIVARGGERQAVGTEGQPRHPVAVAEERRDRLAAARQPDPGRAIRACGSEKLTIGRKQNVQHSAGVPDQSPRRGSSPRIPDCRSGTAAPGDPAVTRDVDGLDERVVRQRRRRLSIDSHEDALSLRGYADLAENGLLAVTP